MTTASQKSPREAGPTQLAPDADIESRHALERSLQDARDNVELMRLYAKSIVRMLEHCEAEVGALRLRAKVPDRLRQTPNIMDLDFVRADVDRLVGETHAQLARVYRGLRQLERKA
ncbi:MAG TPA: hypothetical protein VIR60_06965 [Gammaproteobacteria bacterium]